MTIANPTFKALLLLMVVSIYSWVLGKDVSLLRRDKVQLSTVVEDGLQYQLPSGIGIDGRAVELLSPRTKQYVFFLLRSPTVKADIDFWKQVAASLNNRPDVFLMGYCDSLRCTESIRAMAMHPFPVLMYGDPTSIQAVVNADADGLAIHRSVEGKSSTIIWRGLGGTPAKVTEEVLR